LPVHFVSIIINPATVKLQKNQTAFDLHKAVVKETTGSPKVPNHEILGAQHLNLNDRQKLVTCGTRAFLEHSLATT